VIRTGIDPPPALLATLGSLRAILVEAPVKELDCTLTRAGKDFVRSCTARYEDPCEDLAASFLRLEQRCGALGMDVSRRSVSGSVRDVECEGAGRRARLRRLEGGELELDLAVRVRRRAGARAGLGGLRADEAVVAVARSLGLTLAAARRSVGRHAGRIVDRSALTFVGPPAKVATAPAVLARHGLVEARCGARACWRRDRPGSRLVVRAGGVYLDAIAWRHP
jgi:hypothetical protein